MMHMLIMLVLEIGRKTIAKSCPESLLTAVAVDTCPRNDLEWDDRAARFNCSSISQSCVQQNLFEYHCVLNKDGDGLVEVCAPSAHIFEQKCAEFNSNGNAIQDSFINCSDVSVPCPKAYRSSVAYKYQACYDFASQTKRLEKQIFKRSIHSENDRGNVGITVGIAVGIGFFALGAVLGALVTYFIQKKYRRDERNSEKRKEYGKSETEEIIL